MFMKNKNYSWKRTPTHKIAVYEYSGSLGKSRSFSVHFPRSDEDLVAEIIKWFANQTIFVEDIEYEDRKYSHSHKVLVKNKSTSNNCLCSLELPSFSEQEISIYLEKYLCGRVQ